MCSSLDGSHSRAATSTAAIFAHGTASFPDGKVARTARPGPCRATPQAVIERIEARRRQRWTGKAIAAEVGVSAVTVSRVLKRQGLNKLSALEPAEPPRRYEREQPGELVHIDIKKLGRFNRVGHRIAGDSTGQSNSRGVGWEFVPVALADASHIAFSRIMKSERKACAIAFLRAAVAYYKKLGITLQRVMTDNGLCYKAKALPKPVATSSSSASAPNPTHLGPTDRLNASSRPPCATGPMPEPTIPPSSASNTCRSGCIATTGIVFIAASAISYRSANSP
jgi:hypothetical protein